MSFPRDLRGVARANNMHLVRVIIDGTEVQNEAGPHPQVRREITGPVEDYTAYLAAALLQFMTGEGVQVPTVKVDDTLMAMNQFVRSTLTAEDRKRLVRMLEAV